MKGPSMLHAEGLSVLEPDPSPLGTFIYSSYHNMLSAAHLPDRSRQVGGRRRHDLDALFSKRVVEAQPPRVQERPRHRERRLRGAVVRGGVAIHNIA